MRKQALSRGGAWKIMIGNDVVDKSHGRRPEEYDLHDHIPEGPKKPGYALVRAGGLIDDTVVSTHGTLSAAEDAMGRAGGTPGSLFTNGLYIASLSTHEVVRLPDGRRTIRPIGR